MAKERITVTIDEDILGLFKSYCDSNFINPSRVVNSLIKEWIGKQERIEFGLASKMSSNHSNSSDRNSDE